MSKSAFGAPPSAAAAAILTQSAPGAAPPLGLQDATGDELELTPGGAESTSTTIGVLQNLQRLQLELQRGPLPAADSSEEDRALYDAAKQRERKKQELMEKAVKDTGLDEGTVRQALAAGVGTAKEENKPFWKKQKKKEDVGLLMKGPPPAEEEKRAYALFHAHHSTHPQPGLELEELEEEVKEEWRALQQEGIQVDPRRMFFARLERKHRVNPQRWWEAVVAALEVAKSRRVKWAELEEVERSVSSLLGYSAAGWEEEAARAAEAAEAKETEGGTGGQQGGRSKTKRRRNKTRRRKDKRQKRRKPTKRSRRRKRTKRSRRRKRTKRN